MSFSLCTDGGKTYVGRSQSYDIAWSYRRRQKVRKAGKVRLCLDSKKVKVLTVKDAHPLSHVEDTLSRLAKAEFISSLYLKNAFWQIPLDIGSREKMALTISNQPVH